MSDKLNWGIIGAGHIAGAFARGVAHSQTGVLAAVGSRSQEKADAFGKEFGAVRCHGSYEALLADKGVQAVYIATPHPLHAEWAIQAAQAGKHILCEKPITLNWPQAMAVIEAARRSDVFFMEAFMYRCHPQTAKLVELLRQRVIGDVRIIRASFSFQGTFNPEGRLYNNSLGGGGILDVGCYPVSLARLVAGVAGGGEIAEPIDVKAVGHLCPTGVDSWSLGVLKFPGDILAQIAGGTEAGMDNTVQIYGTEGTIFIPSPWVVSREGGTSKIVVTVKGQADEIVIETPDYLYGLEADTVARCIERRQGAFPAMSWEDTLGNMRTLDRWREQIGLVYESEKPGARD
jgi:predicted dehydrogenase